ncbi:MAG TPA: DUF523 and DUF1722 domain-containing protein [Candidatus Binatia bacterium]
MLSIIDMTDDAGRFKPKVGISACLLGEKVRFDGGHKRDLFLTETLSRFVDWVPVCPEIEAGMGVPRESVRLTGTRQRARMIAEKTGKDWTSAMRRFAAVRTLELASLNLSGYVFKKNSPSCGIEKVRVYNSRGIPAWNGRGLFAAEVMSQFPLLPVEDEGRLHDPALRENFIERVFAYARWQLTSSAAKSLGRLGQFHTVHKLLLLAHSERHYRQLGRLVANGKKQSLGSIYDQYGSVFMQALAIRATVKKHANVLEHMTGYFSQQLSAAERAELVELIRDYRKRLAPLIAPITLIRHYIKKYAVGYLQQQVYLCPSPKELMLRNPVNRWEKAHENTSIRN